MSSPADQPSVDSDANTGTTATAPPDSHRPGLLPSQRGRGVRRVVGYSLLLCVVVLIVAGGWLLGTASGAQALVQQVLPRLPMQLTIAQVNGRLLGPLQLTDLEFRSNAVTAKVAKLSLDWQPTQLLSKIVQVDYLRLQGVDVQLTPTPAPPSEEPFELPNAIALPVDVDLQELTINDMRLQQGETAVAVRQAQLVANWVGERLTLSRVELGAENYSVVANGRVAFAGNYPVQISLAPQASIPGYAPVAGLLDIAGSLDNLGINLVLAPPYELSLDGTLLQLLQDPAVDLKLTAAPASLETLSADLPVANVAATMSVAGKLKALIVAGQARYSAAGQPALEAKWQAQVSPTGAQLQPLEFRLADQPQPLSIIGDVGWQDGLQAQLLATAERLPLPFGDEPTYLRELRLAVSGNLEGYELRGTTGWEFAEQVTPVQLHGVGNQQQFTLERLRLGMSDTDPQAQLLLTGELAWSAGINGQFQLNGSAIDPKRFVAQPAGQVDIRAAVGIAGQPGATPEVSISNFNLGGELGGESLRGSGSAKIKETDITLAGIELGLASARIRADGKLGQNHDLAFSLDATKLEQIGAVFGLPLSGSLQVAGSVAGTREQPRLNAKLQAAEIQYAASRVAKARLVAELDFAATSSLDLTATNLVLAGQTIKELQLNGSGTQAQHQAQFELTTNTAAANLVGRVSGSYEADGRWNYSAEQLVLTYTMRGSPQQDVSGAPADSHRWSLLTPANGWVQANNAQFQLDESCLVQTGSGGAGRICLAANNPGQQLAANFSLQQLDLAWLNPLLSPDLKLAGQLAGQGRWQGWAAGTNAGSGTEAKLQLSGMSLAVKQKRTWQPALRFDASQLLLQRAAKNKSGYLLQIDLPIASAGIALDAGFTPQPNLDLMSWPLTGQLALNLPDLDWLSNLISEATFSESSIAGRLKVEGTLGEPRLAGSYRLQAQEIALASPGITLGNTNLALQGRQQQLAVTGATYSGEEPLNVAATVAWQEGLAIDGRLVGTNVLVSDSATARVRVSPDLTVAFADNLLKLRGDLSVPVADIHLRSAPSGALAVSADQEFVGPQAKAEAAPAIALDAKVKLLLGDEVTFDGLGLNARFAGAIVVTEKPKQVASAQGEIKITEGQYQAYGQDLTIERGRVLFAGGPVENPGLDVRAVRQATVDVKVGVNVRGTLREPTLAIFSTPSLPESDQLSYLVLGRPMSGGNASERSALQQAALALGVRGGRMITEQLGSSLGVDTIGIESAPGETNEQAALVIGKYLTPKLYVSYGYGLFEPISTLRMEYQLSRLWRIVTESTNEAAGGDFQWVLEK